MQASLLASLAALAALSPGDPDLRDRVVLVNGDEERGRVIERHHPEHLVLLQNGRRLEFPHGEVAVVETVRDRLRTFLGLRVQGLGLAAEWDLVAVATGLELPELARAQAYHVLLRDPDHAEAHRFLGHEQKRGKWRWVHDGKGYGRDDFDERISAWKTRLVLPGEHFTVETNAGLRAAVDALFDLERLYLFWMDGLGAELQATEDVDAPDEEEMTVRLFREKDDRGFTEILSSEREPYYDPSTTTATRGGNPNLAFTYFEPGSGRPLRLFDLGTQQLLYSTLVLGKTLGSAPADARTRHAHWAELGLGYWVERQLHGPPGYATDRPFAMEPAMARAALLRPSRRSPLRDARHELTNLIGMEFIRFYGTRADAPIHRAKARAAVAFLLDADPPVPGDGQARGRAAFLHYVRAVFGEPRAHSSDALDEGLGGARVEVLEEAWRAWLRSF